MSVWFLFHCSDVLLCDFLLCVAGVFMVGERLTVGLVCVCETAKALREWKTGCSEYSLQFWLLENDCVCKRGGPSGHSTSD